jgi:hypothetical protein
MSARRLAAALGALALLASCGQQASGVEAGGGTAVADCWDKAGLSTAGADGWSAARQRAFLARRGAMVCVVEESEDQDGLEDVVRPAYAETDPAEVMKGVTAYVHDAEGPPLETSRNAGELVAAMTESDAFDPETSLGLREQIGWQVYRADAGAVPAYDTWKQRNPAPSDGPATPDLSFIKTLENAHMGSAEAEIYDEVERYALEVRRGYEQASG